MQEETVLAGHSIGQMTDRYDRPLPEGPGRDFSAWLYSGARLSPRSLWTWGLMPC